jgi:hypothetical protein
MKTKTYTIQTKLADETGQFSAVLGTFGQIDGDGDVLMPGAFGRQKANVLPCHDWSAVPIGRAEVFETSTEVQAHGQLNLAIQQGRDWHSWLQFDMTHGEPKQEWSFGFDVLEESRGEFNGDRVRFLEKLKIHEISPVVKAAGVDTRTLSVKERGLPKHMRDSLNAIRLLTEYRRSQEQIRSIEQRALTSQLYQDYLQIKDDYLTCHYLKLADSSVIPEQERELAAWVVESVATELGIVTPPIIWFSPESSKERELRQEFGAVLEGIQADREIWGAARDAEIWLDSGLTGGDLAATACHETLHVAYPNLSEDEVLGFEARFMATWDEFGGIA